MESKRESEIRDESRGVTVRERQEGLGKAGKGGLSQKGKGVGKQTRVWETWREKKKVVMNVT